MVTAFVLINVEDRKVHDVAERLSALDGVTELHVVAGEYDMVAVVRVPTNPELSQLITREMIHVPGVHRTKTLFSLETFSRFDLEKLFVS